MMNFYSLFNEKMMEFAKDLCDVFPDEGEFKRFRSGVLMLQNLEPKTLENIFRNYVVSKYRTQILNKDEAFFLKHNQYDFESQSSDYWLNMIDQIKNMWKVLDNENKEIIWTYFHVLIVLSDKCH